MPTGISRLWNRAAEACDKRPKALNGADGVSGMDRHRRRNLVSGGRVDRIEPLILA
jgi:hypothetical protein